MNMKTVPEEILFRWRHGQISGYHVVLEKMLVNDAGDFDAEANFFQIGAAQTFDQAGIALPDILQGLNTSFVSAYDAMKADLDKERRDRADEQARYQLAIQNLQTEIEKRDQTIERLNAQLATVSQA